MINKKFVRYNLKLKNKRKALKYAKPRNPCGSIYIYISTILQNKEEINLINKVRVGVNSTLKSIYKEKRKT